MRQLLVPGLATLVVFSLVGDAAPLGDPYVEPDGTSYPAYWLEEKILGQWERVALVFGYVDDKGVCEEWAAWRQSRYPADEYRCSQIVGSVLYFPDSQPDILAMQ